MTQRLVHTFGLVALVGAVVAGCASEGTTGLSAVDRGSAPASTKTIDRIASGAVEDTLAACMARIPKDSSAGQRMLAEESCRRDQAARR
jgi:outer membrane murein-binding lipoprotein Lpp